MGAPLETIQQESIRLLFEKLGSIRAVVKATGLARNTIRKSLMSEGLSDLLRRS